MSQVKLIKTVTTKISPEHVLSLDGDYAHLDNTVDLMVHWHAVATRVAELKKEMEPFDEARKALDNAITRSLTIPDGELESEKISIPGVGSCSKKMVAGLKVFDWMALQKWCPENGYSEIIQKRTSQAPVQSLEADIMEGKIVLPPEIAVIEPYSKTTITKARITK